MPKGDKTCNFGKYWILDKALYNLKQTGRKCYKEVST